MSRLAAVCAAVLGAALAAYPFTLAPAHPNVWPLAVASSATLGAALVRRRSWLVAATATLVMAEYSLALLTGDRALDPIAPLVATALFLLVELLDIRCLTGGGVVDETGLRRKVTHALWVSSLGCVLALVVAVAGALSDLVPGWFAIVSIACSIGVLALLSTLATRATQVPESAPIGSDAAKTLLDDTKSSVR